MRQLLDGEAKPKMTATSISIGDVRIGHPFVQAALLATASPCGGWRVVQFLVKRTSHFLYITDDERPGGQLMGAEPEQFAANWPGFDVIDINFGCPVKKVLGVAGDFLSQPEVCLRSSAALATWCRRTSR